VESFHYSPAVMRFVTALVASTLLLAPLTSLRAAGEGVAVIHGYVFRNDEATRLAGAEVAAINVSTGRRYVSARTGDNGAYEIAGMPPGTYDIAIDTKDDNIYVTDSLIDLSERQHLTLSFSLKPKGGTTPGAPSEGGAAVIFTDPQAVPPDAPAAPPGKKGKSGTETPKKKHSSSPSSGGSSASYRPAAEAPATTA
jgi:hypothetical protein